MPTQLTCYLPPWFHLDALDVQCKGVLSWSQPTLPGLYFHTTCL